MIDELFHIALILVVSGNFSINNAYVRLTLEQWRLLFGIAVATHIRAGVILPKLIMS